MEGGRLWRLALKAWPKRLGLGAWSFPAWRVQARGKGMQVRLADATLQLEPYHLRGEATTPLSRAPGLGWVASQPARPASQQCSQLQSAQAQKPAPGSRLYYSDSLAGHPGDPLQYP